LDALFLGKELKLFSVKRILRSWGGLAQKATRLKDAGEDDKTPTINLKNERPKAKSPLGKEHV